MSQLILNSDSEVPLASTKAIEFDDPSGAPPQPTCPKQCVGSFRSLFLADSILGATLNMSNATIGVGIVFLPNVLRECGIMLGLILLATGAMLGSITLFLLYRSFIRVSEEGHPDVKDYEEVGKICVGEGVFGQILSFLIQGSICILNLGGTIAFTIVIRHSLSGFLASTRLASKEWAQALVLLAVMIPILLVSFFPRIASLRILSIISVLSVVVFCFMIILSFALGWTKKSQLGPTRWWVWQPGTTIWGVLSVIGVIVFAFSFHTILYPIVSQFQPQNRYKTVIAVFSSVLLDYTFYACVAGFGYISFFNATRPDIILSFENAGIESAGNGAVFGANFLRVLLLISVVLSWPLCCYVARYTLTNLILDIVRLSLRCCAKKESPSVDEKPESKDRDLKVLRVIVSLGTTVLVCVVSYLLAVFWPRASDIFGLVGSTGAIFTVYVFPCVFFLLLAKPTCKDWRLWGVMAILLVGIFGGIVSTIGAFTKLIKK